jgi:hypothetical protein
MNKLITIGLSSLLIVWALTACSFVHTKESTYFTVGHARVEECNQIVHVDDKEDIKFGCKTYYSEGVSAEFAGIIKALFGWLPWPY